MSTPDKFDEAATEIMDLLRRLELASLDEAVEEGSEVQLEVLAEYLRRKFPQ